VFLNNSLDLLPILVDQNDLVRIELRRLERNERFAVAPILGQHRQSIDGSRKRAFFAAV
jgi:hypothetical protein